MSHATNQLTDLEWGLLSEVAECTEYPHVPKSEARCALIVRGLIMLVDANRDTYAVTKSGMNELADHKQSEQGGAS